MMQSDYLLSGIHCRSLSMTASLLLKLLSLLVLYSRSECTSEQLRTTRPAARMSVSLQSQRDEHVAQTGQGSLQL